MRCDIRQLAGKGTVNDSSITTLATEKMVRSPLPSPRTVRFSEQATRSTRPQYAPPRPMRPAAAGNSNRVFIPSLCNDRRTISNGRYNGQSERQRTMRPMQSTNPLCSRCGYNQNDNAMRCPAIGKQCWMCSRFGHLRAVCRAGGRFRE